MDSSAPGFSVLRICLFSFQHEKSPHQASPCAGCTRCESVRGWSRQKLSRGVAGAQVGEGPCGPLPLALTALRSTPQFCLRDPL